ncbi:MULTISPECIES: carboxypeptidase regulatory-like domain-containing protein [unclassified Microcoleus]|uniref:carboxypeptidase regulatory-like domain-containing protein n=1 Tax=unclassified Microcoleus TaxID=2642155 RepID=UPI002FCF36E6
MSAKEQTKNRVAIAGRVIDAETKLAIAGALVEVSQKQGKFKNWLDLHALQYAKSWEKMVKRPDRTLTAIDGWFYFVDLPDADECYTLTVSRPSAGTRYGVANSETIKVVYFNNDRITWTPIGLPPTAIKGRITDSKNCPIFMAKVQVAGSSESAFSDKDGDYFLHGLEVCKPQQKKTITIKVYARGYEEVSQSVEISQGQILEPINLSLQANNLTNLATSKINTS